MIEGEESGADALCTDLSVCYTIQFIRSNLSLVKSCLHKRNNVLL